MTEEIKVNPQEEGTPKYKTIKREIEVFLSLSGGHVFVVEALDRQFRYESREAKRYRWQILERLVKDSKVERLGTGKYRLILHDLEEIKWQTADPTDTVLMSWPLKLEQYVKVYHKSVIIIAGAPASGKTAFIYDTILRNIGHKMPMVLFTNDMTAEEIRERVDNYGITIPNSAPWRTYERFDNFGDVVEPDSLNFIDYLDLNSEVYLIGDEIDKIYRKLNHGIAVVAIQKRPGQDIGLGGLFSWKRAKLYLSLDTLRDQVGLFHTLKIVKARGRADPKVNPTNMQFKCLLVGGVKFITRQ